MPIHISSSVMARRRELQPELERAGVSVRTDFSWSWISQAPGTAPLEGSRGGAQGAFCGLVGSSSTARLMRIPARFKKGQSQLRDLQNTSKTPFYFFFFSPNLQCHPPWLNVSFSMLVGWQCLHFESEYMGFPRIIELVLLENT